MPGTRHAVLAVAGACMLSVTLGCSRRSDEQRRATESQSIGQTSASAGTAARQEPRSLQRLPLSAYGVTLAADDEAIYVLASRGAYRFADGQPGTHWAIELGDTPALGSRGFVYWLDGKLRLAPKHGGPAELLASVPQAPRRLVAAGERLAWVEQEALGGLLRTVNGSEPKTIYRASGELEALALVDEHAIFVERNEARWRLGSVALGGGAPRFTEPRATRTPAALTAAGGDVFYYDGPSSTVRRVPWDLSREDVAARDVICSPLAVADRIYCSQISLLFEIPREGGRARSIAPRRGGTITAVVATRNRVAWLLDMGDDRTELEVLPR